MSGRSACIVRHTDHGYQWAEEYFRSAGPKEKPRNAASAPQKGKEVKTEKPARNPADEGQMSLLDLGLPAAG